MVSITIRTKVIPEKRMEFSQAVTSLIASTRTEEGCYRCGLYQSVEDENEFFLFGDWKTINDLSRHLHSELFKVLLGAMILLKEPHTIRFLMDCSKAESARLTGQPKSS